MGALIVTGATGFVGRAVVAEARARRLSVVAVSRSGRDLWPGDDGVTVLKADLSDSASIAPLKTALAGAGALVHAAAHLGGDAKAVTRDSIRGTETVLAALRGSPARLVLVSSIVVYDTMALAPGDALTETSPMEQPDKARDAYTAGKLRQEALVAAENRPAWLMRPGAVYGPGRSWHALLGFWASKLFVAIDSGGELPLVHVDHLARSLVDAASTDPDGIQALNVVDDDRPDRARFIAAHRAAAGWPKLVLRLPYGAWLRLARVLKPVGTKLPGLFREPVLRARLMPLRYPNTALRAALGGADNAPFEEMLHRSIEVRP